MSDELRQNYVAYCPGCGSMCCAMIDDPKHPKDVAKEVGKWIAQGLRVERASHADVRAIFAGCKCKQLQTEAQLQPKLF